MAFSNPIGLAAGFDYNAQLTGILSSIGFGFETIGTITNMPYEGNPMPRLGRLPKSKSLMVNKGFKNKGAKNIVEKLDSKKFKIPIGISIGRTNSALLQTQEESVTDIVNAFKTFEQANINNAYYELNISCPNLIHGNKSITFYNKENLTYLLDEVSKLKITKPIFAKMPIVLENDKILELLQVITKYNLNGVIFGNLETRRDNKFLDPSEVKLFEVGNFSGKPTSQRSNELIELAFKNFGHRLTIIGCGGVFSGEDAYEKIIRGATLIQLVTGMVYEGPRLISNINRYLANRLKQDGYKKISDIVGLNFR
jgi:dihydroorotate dehydrogenase subfamily 2